MSSASKAAPAMNTSPALACCSRVRHFFDSLTVWENVAFGLIQGRGISRVKAKDIAIDKLGQVGLNADVGALYPAELSGGMQKRVALARAIAADPEIIFFDEPTTGLHFHDVAKLLEVLHELADAGNTVVVIEHNLEVIKTADWIIDMGPEGGDGGGRVVAQGTPEDVARVKESYTGQYLRELLGRRGRAAQSNGRGKREAAE
ncbi:MAG: ATP-binding cassette domain-containing protein [Rhodospirillales bacterium]|nr:ATP-binding cassette domain-containing protein [Rhodospirillales bacterium]